MYPPDPATWQRGTGVQGIRWPDSHDKPLLYVECGWWYCESIDDDYIWLGSGNSPAVAYRDWARHVPASSKHYT